MTALSLLGFLQAGPYVQGMQGRMMSPHVQQVPPHAQHGPPPGVRPRSSVNNTSRRLDELSMRCLVVDGCGLSGMESGDV